MHLSYKGRFLYRKRNQSKAFTLAFMTHNFQISKGINKSVSEQRQTKREIGILKEEQHKRHKHEVRSFLHPKAEEDVNVGYQKGQHELQRLNFKETSPRNKRESTHENTSQKDPETNCQLSF